MNARDLSAASLAVEGLGQSFDGHQVLDRIDFALQEGEVLALLGPSGCGKSTLLKLLAGLLAPTRGRILMAGKVMADRGRAQPPEARNLGMVFQDYALWPHMTVGANVAFPLQMRGVPRREQGARVDEALALVGLAGYAERRPSSLSGGQQQRVALARAVVARPPLLLFDEPMSNLDRDLRESLCDEISELLGRLGTTAVYVTHDHEEAFSLADRVAVMGDGGIRQLAPAEQLIADPASVAVARFLKQGNLLPVQAEAGVLRLEDGTVLPGGLTTPVQGTGQLYVPHTALRPVAEGGLPCQVVTQRYRAGHYATTVAAGGPAGMHLELLTEHRLPAHAPISLGLDWSRVRWFAQAA